MCGAKYPPAPATTGMLNGGAIDSAHMALDSDCFSNATASTRRCRPACTKLAATMAVAPPTEPAVCTRSSGLPAAPSASARYSSGIITPSNRSGAFPITSTAAGCFTLLPSLGLHDAHEVPLQRRAASRVPEGPSRAARHDRLRRHPDPGQPGGEHRVAAQRAARGIHLDLVAQPQRLPEQDLLMGEG